MFGLMRVSTHERILDEYRKRHEQIIDDLADNLWAASDEVTKRYIAKTPGVTLNFLNEKKYGIRRTQWPY